MSNSVDSSGKIDIFHDDFKKYYDTPSDSLDLLNVTNLPTNEYNKIRDFVYSHSDLFSKHELDIGRIKGFQAKIEVDTIRDVEMKYIPVPKIIQPRVRKILKEYERIGVIEVCNEVSPIVSNIICLKNRTHPKLD